MAVVWNKRANIRTSAAGFPPGRKSGAVPPLIAARGDTHAMGEERNSSQNRHNSAHKGAQNRAAPGFIPPIMACIATCPAVNAEIYYLDKFIIYTYSLRA